jgi:tetratricopeptide (TPR) repeat protein
MTTQLDPYRRIYALSRRGEFSAALAGVLDEEGRIRPAFREDLNHAWYCVGDLLYRLDQFDEAMCAFRRSLRSRPADAEALMAVGNCYDDLGRPKMAERFYRRALASDELEQAGISEGLRYNLANTLFDQGRMKEAVRIYTQLGKARSAEIRRKASLNIAAAARFLAGHKWR